MTTHAIDCDMGVDCMEPCPVAMHAAGQPHRKGSGRDEWRTPPYFFEHVQRTYGVTFTRDCAADADNSLCDLHCSEHESFFDTPDQWFKGQVCWLNPPFSKMAVFTERVLHLAAHGATVFMLGPSAMDTKYSHRMLASPTHRPVFTRGRISFIDPVTRIGKPGNPIGSVLWVPVSHWDGAFSIERG